MSDLESTKHAPKEQSLASRRCWSPTIPRTAASLNNCGSFVKDLRPDDLDPILDGRIYRTKEAGLISSVNLLPQFTLVWGESNF